MPEACRPKNKKGQFKAESSSHREKASLHLHLPIGGDQTTFFIPANERKMMGGEMKELNDVGRALVLIHEGIHADINATENFWIGVNSDHHDDYTEDMHGGIVKGLEEFNKANKLGLSDEQISLVAWNGLQGSPMFNDHFGLDPNYSDYQSNLDKINSQINSIIYNSENEKSRYNIKN